jgi:FkbM family methyltransferase
MSSLQNSNWFFRLSYLEKSFIRCVLQAQSWMDRTYFYWIMKPKEGFRSQFGQDFVFQDLGIARNPGFFVEVGSNHPEIESNTYILEKVFGWTGLAIDPLDYRSDFKTLRGKTTFINCLVLNRTEKVEFFKVSNVDGWENRMSSIFESELKNSKFLYEKVEVDSLPLRQLIPVGQKVDLMLLDVEGAEIDVLDSLNWDLQAPIYILIENTGRQESRRKLNRYLSGRGYRMLARIGFSDQLWKIS